MGTSASETAKLYKMLAEGKPSWVRLMHKLLGSEDPPAKTDQKGPTASTEVDISVDIKAIKALAGIGDILRPRQGAANMFPDARREGNEACPSRIPSFPASRIG